MKCCSGIRGQPTVSGQGGRGIGGFEELILSMYAKGMSSRDIQHHVKEIYNHDISPETVSRITDAVLDKAKKWQNRPLEPIYSIVLGQEAGTVRKNAGFAASLQALFLDTPNRSGRFATTPGAAATGRRPPAGCCRKVS